MRYISIVTVMLCQCHSIFCWNCSFVWVDIVDDTQKCIFSHSLYRCWICNGFKRLLYTYRQTITKTIVKKDLFATLSNIIKNEMYNWKYGRQWKKWRWKWTVEKETCFVEINECKIFEIFDIWLFQNSKFI